MHVDEPNADRRFVDYYAERSTSDETRQRFLSVQRIALKLRSNLGLSIEGLDIADIGCGVGTQTLMWAAGGHRARGVDISSPLIELARQRAQVQPVSAEFFVASATELPLADQSCDLVLVSELLEHLPDWESCIREALRILRPGGVIYISTTNRLCPIQQEFTLPGYSWYPSSVKKRCERLAVTTHRHWVQHASFPAVHWFSFYDLRDYLIARGVTAYDRFDVSDAAGSTIRLAVLKSIRGLRLLRFAAHVCTPYTIVVGVRRPNKIA
jgi:2-polyprenyl-6-hydroxyphenyl methylase/3-demethylubiquinone-9 3-methyltransferase